MSHLQSEFMLHTKVIILSFACLSSHHESAVLLIFRGEASPISHSLIVMVSVQVIERVLQFQATVQIVDGSEVEPKA